MGLILLMLYLLTGECEAMIVRRYGKKRREAGMFFNALICLFASTFFIINNKGIPAFPGELLVFSAINCILYAGGFYFMYEALSSGSYIGAKMLSAASVIIPISFGIIFLKEEAGIATCAAILMMFLSLFLQIYEKGGDKTKVSSSKWIIYALLSALCNGFITVISRTQQIRFAGAYDNVFLFFSFLGAFLFLVIISYIKEGRKIKSGLKSTIIYGAGTGLLNGVKNFLNLMILLYIPLSVASPLKIVLGYIVSFFISVYFFKETITRKKLVGIVAGVISVALFQL